MAPIYFRQTDYALTLFGLKLYNSSNLIKCFQLVLLTVFIIIDITLTLHIMIFMRPINLQWIEYSTPPISAIVIKIFIYRKRRNIRQLLSTTEQWLSDQQIRLVTKISKRCLTTYLLIWLTFIALTNLWFFSNKDLQSVFLADIVIDRSDWSKWALSVVIMIGHYCSCWPSIYLTVSIYYLVLVIVRETTRSYFSSCLQNWFLNKRSLQDMKIRNNIISGEGLVDIYDQFNQLFDLYPLIWCVLIYLKTSALILYFVNWSSGATSSSTIGWLVHLIDWMSTTVYFTLALHLATQVVSSIEKEKKVLIRQLSLQAVENPSINSLIKVIETLELKLTGYRMFNIEQNMFLPLFGSLITFSILFAQITGVRVS